MRNRPIIGLDLDGVLYKFNNTAAWLLNTHRGYSLPKEPLSWHGQEELVSRRDWNWLFKQGIRDHGLFRHGHMYLGAVQGVADLAAIGDVIVITKRPKRAERDTVDWINFHRLPVSEIHVIGEAAKSSIPCDVYIDDSPKVMLDININTLATGLLWDRPWNRDETLAGWTDTYRVRSWQEVCERTRRLAV